MPGCHGRLIQQRHTVPVISIVTSTFIPIRLPYLVVWSEVFKWPECSGAMEIQNRGHDARGPLFGARPPLHGPMKVGHGTVRQDHMVTPHPIRR